MPQEKNRQEKMPHKKTHNRQTREKRERLFAYEDTIQVDAEIVLSPVELSLTEVIFRTCLKNKENFRPFLPRASSLEKEEDTRRFIEDCLQKAAEGEEFTYAIFYASPSEDGVSEIRFCGLVCMGIKEEEESFEPGYWLDRDFRKKGIMTRSVQTLNELFFTCGFRRSVISFAEGNTESGKIPRRLGYRFWEKRPAREIIEGRTADHLVYVKDAP